MHVDEFISYFIFFHFKIKISKKKCPLPYSFIEIHDGLNTVLCCLILNLRKTLIFYIVKISLYCWGYMSIFQIIIPLCKCLYFFCLVLIDVESFYSYILPFLIHGSWCTCGRIFLGCVTWKELIIYGECKC